MDCYAYKAALWCADCGEKLREELTAQGKAPADQDDEASYDSDDFPKGPYATDSNEADCPHYCDGCGAFLENPLTGDGERYVREAIEKALIEGKRPDAAEGAPRYSVALAEWRGFYDIEPADPRAIRLGRMTKAMREQADAKTGELPAYAWPGGYPIFYMTHKSCDVVCVKCANDHETGLDAFGDERIGASDVNWEEPDLYCDCGERIESAYAEPDENDAPADESSSEPSV